MSVKKQRIINCVSQLPYKIQLGESNDDWKIEAAVGSSALYSSLDFLNSDEEAEKYEQHVIGWTGEITRQDDFASRLSAHHEKKEKTEEGDTMRISSCLTCTLCGYYVVINIDGGSMPRM